MGRKRKNPISSFFGTPESEEPSASGEAPETEAEPAPAPAPQDEPAPAAPEQPVVKNRTTGKAKSPTRYAKLGGQ